jgi:hypothetical protein
MPRGVALTCPRTYNNNSRHIPLWLRKGGANALHLITNNLTRIWGQRPLLLYGVSSRHQVLAMASPARCHPSMTKPGAMATSTMACRHDINLHHRQVDSHPTTRARHPSEVDITILLQRQRGQHYAFEHPLRWDAPSSFYSLRSDAARGTNGHVIEGRSDTLSTCLHQVGYWEQCSAPVRPG